MSGRSWARRVFPTLCLVLLGALASAGAPSRAEEASTDAGGGVRIERATLLSPLPRQAGRPRIGLALSGGGARGFAHVGVLRVLEQLRVPVDCIAATSAGAAVGAAWASGLSADEIETRLRAVDWGEIFDDAPARRDQTWREKSDERDFGLGVSLGFDRRGVRTPSGLVAGHRVELFLHELLGLSAELPSFDQLPLPFRAVATDLATGEMVLQDHGSLVRAVRASMSVPSAFAPVREDGRILVDGGLTRNLPVDIVREQCADVVIAVNIGSPLLREDDLQSFLGVAMQMVHILVEANVRRSLGELRTGDILITPQLGALSSADFARSLEGVPAGERAVREQAGLLGALSLPPLEWEAWDRQRRERGERLRGTQRVDDVRVTGTRFVDPTTLEARLGIEAAHEKLDPADLAARMARVMARGDLSRIGYRLIPEQGTQVLSVEPEEKSWGPNYLRFGIGAAGDSKANSYFNLLLGVRRTWLNSLGAEWATTLQFGRTQRLATEWFQPIEIEGRWYVAPRLSYEDRPLDIFDGQHRVAEYGIATSQMDLALGRQSRVADLRLALSLGERRIAPRIGSTLLPRVAHSFAAGTASVSIDQLDAIDFPREGYAFTLQGFFARPLFGTEEQYNRVETRVRHALSSGAHSVSTLLWAGRSPGSTLPAYDAFSLGGFMNLTGYQINQFVGGGVNYGRITYYNQVMPLPRPFGSGLYAGATLEVGRILDPVLTTTDTRWLPGMGLYVGANTAIGPVYLGVGRGRADNRAVYLFLGRP